MTGRQTIRRHGLLALASTFALLLCLGASASRALTFLMVSDENLADQAAAIAEVDVLTVAPAADSAFSSVDYVVLVERVLKGSLGSTVSIRLPGNGPLDGGLSRIAGIPVFSQGSRLLVFLVPTQGGTYGLLHLTLGAFEQLYSDMGRVAVRDLREAVELGSADGDADAPIRDYDLFAEWLIDRGRGQSRPADYLMKSASPAESIGERSTLLPSPIDGRSGRWFEFDQGGTVQWYVNGSATSLAVQNTQAFVRALQVWSEQPATRVNLAFAGTASGLPDVDGRNVVTFGDPFDYMPGRFSCDSGGILGMALPLPFIVATGQMAKYNGVRYHKIEEAEIILNDGVDCFFDGNPTGAEEVLGHELGHTLGIGHSCGNGVSRCPKRLEDEALMRAYAHNDGRGSRLNSDDLKALSSLYGTFDPPSGLNVTVRSSTVLVVRWTDNTIDEKKFRVELGIGTAGNFVDLGTVPANSTGAQISNLPPGSVIRLRVRAEKRSRSSDWSQIVSVTMPN